MPNTMDPLALRLYGEDFVWVDNRLYRFVLGQDHAIWQCHWSGSQWSHYTSLGGDCASAPSVLYWGNHRLDLFVRWQDSTIRHKFRTEGRWSEWHSLGGDMISAPAAVASKNKVLNLFALGREGQIYQNSFKDNQTTQWFAVGKRSTSTPSVTSQFTQESNVSYLEVFGLTETFKIDWLYDSPSWVKRGQTVDKIFSSPAATVWANHNLLFLFGRGEDKRIYFARSDGRTTGNWEVVDNDSDSKTILAGAGPVAIARGVDKVDLFVRTEENALIHKHWDGTMWSRWQTMVENAFIHRVKESSVLTFLEHPLLANYSRALAFETANLNPRGGNAIANPHPTGVAFYSSANYSQWAIVNEDLKLIAKEAAFNVIIPDPTDTVFLHRSRVANITEYETIINHPLLNHQADALPFVTQNYNPGLAGNICNPHPIGIVFSGERWSIVNQDQSPMPVNAMFNVWLADPTTAIVHHATKENRFEDGTLLNHPALNNNPDALLLVTQRVSWRADASPILNPHQVGVTYLTQAQRWMIVNLDQTPIPEQATFHVLVEPSQRQPIWRVNLIGSWVQVGGSLKHISAGCDGTAWGVNAQDDIFQWHSGRWQLVPGKLKQIAVGNADHVWGVNFQDDVFRRIGDGWALVPGRLKYISVGCDGTVWGVNAQDLIFRWDSDHWTLIPGSLKQISVGNANNVWGVNANNAVFTWNSGQWQAIPKQLKHISVASDRTIWGINEFDEIVRMDSSGWAVIPGRLKQIAVGGANHIWGVTIQDDIFVLDTNGFNGTTGNRVSLEL